MPPVGLDGELINTARVRGPIAASSGPAWMRKPSAGEVGTSTGRAPAKRICSAKLTQAGVGSTTSSPSSKSASASSKRAVLPPTVTMTSLACQGAP